MKPEVLLILVLLYTALSSCKKDENSTFDYWCRLIFHYLLFRYQFQDLNKLLKTFGN